MITYVKRDIQRAFDYLKICNDDLMQTASKAHEKGLEAYSDKVYEAKGFVIDAIEKLAEANAIKTKRARV